MGTFTSKLKLGDHAFGVSGGLNSTIKYLTIGQLRVIETLPAYHIYEDDTCYKEEYMCIETGVGCGIVWTYGKDIFATIVEAQQGVIAQLQAAHKQRAEREAMNVIETERQRKEDLRTLERLKQKYETN